MRLYHFLNEQYGRENIRNRQLKIARIPDLNDPFELLCMDLSDERVRREFNGRKESMSKDFGLLCFSRNWSNPVQWGHYADRHRGLCLGFEVPPSFHEPIVYAPKRLPLEVASTSMTKALMKKVLYTKFAHWRYEQEERAFLRLEDQKKNRGLYFEPFSDEQMKLVEVIVGARSTISRSELKATIGNLEGVTVFKARPAFQSFRVVRNRNESLWT